MRDVVVDAGAFEAWTPSLGSDADFDLLHPGRERVRITNPLSSEESVLARDADHRSRASVGQELERGTGDVVLAEFGVVFEHPSETDAPRVARGGVGGAQMVSLPRENERVTIVLGRPDDDARSAVDLWRMIEGRLGLERGRRSFERGSRWTSPHPHRSPRRSSEWSDARLRR